MKRSINLRRTGPWGHLVIKRSPRARRMALRLDPKERVFHLVLPPGVPIKKAKEFAREHKEWMLEQLMELPEPVPFVHGAVIPVFGKNRTLSIHKKKSFKTTDFILKYNELIVLTNLDDPTPRIRRYLMKLAKEEISRLAHKKAGDVRKKIASIHVRDTKSRWGSCSEDGNLSFSWRLIFAPYEALDYVVAHEVAHLKHLDHSKNFWRVCRALSDDFLEGHYWMSHHGNDLMSYGQPPAE